ncbi:MAG: VWA domain-containing protein [Burkholderiales bacterium]|nr:VWA domain-containing protein [Burkholderiales bacterium]
MVFLWPELLWLLLAVPLLVAAYLWALRRRTRAAVRFASLDLVRPALGRSARWRRHLPPLLLLIALVVTIVGVARPQMRVTLPTMQQTVILAVDVSLSMGADDVEPTRLTAAQAAARAFVEERPRDVRVGLVAFGGNAIVVQQPTTNRDDLLAAIDRFELQRGTATGSALYAALATLLPDIGIDLQALDFKWENVRNMRDPNQFKLKPPPMKEVAPVAPGSFDTGAIVLMSDGKSTIGPSPLDAARVVADRGVRVFTVGFGTKEGAMVRGEGWAVYVRLDEETLQAIAAITKGAYFHASTGAELKKIYRDLNTRFVLERKEVEVTFVYAAAAALLLLVAIVLSLLWFGPALRRR